MIDSLDSPLSIKGLIIPALLGWDIERVIISESKLFNISIKNFELKPIWISSPEYWHSRFSSALLLKSKSSALIFSNDPANLSLTWLVVLLENILTLLAEFRNSCLSIVKTFGLSFGITAS